MISHNRSTLARLGAVALLAAGGLATVAAPAHAADQADLAVVPVSSALAKGVTEANLKPFKFTVYNLTESVTARNVTVTVDTAELKANRVGYLIPDGCTVSGTRFTCLLGDLAGGTTGEFGLPLFSTGGKGNGGSLTVTVRSDNPDPQEGNNSETVDITVTKPGYDLSAWSQDVYADVVVDADSAGETGLTPVAPGDTAPLDWVVYNGGSSRATGVLYGLSLPKGATFAELPESCEQQSLGDLTVAYCEESGLVLEPGEFWTDAVRVKVGADVTGKVLTPGVLFAVGLDRATGEEPAEEPRRATGTQRKTFEEVDEADNNSVFDIFVGEKTSPSPTPTGTATPTVAPTAPGDGDGGAGGGGPLPVTGAQAGLIGGIGLAVLAAGAVLFVLARRRRVVLVTPGDEKPTV
ncbi:LPXTG cell wall anchor domain-containing protein [Micromonospora echinofusca]|uniref:LPXTG cell wall anchor domain-containing protein n=1 Tax=Micromonospora echinofusca TaxID=47858 RepID=A0ABS3VMZ1_MICEH|nr:LPXTG cell wall anchor domain-containing protein [Micromonospora echinofusca]MBO4205744.1 LPXTG cell wall anchor domain-containing protein [Micromonospora echinofusca]